MEIQGEQRAGELGEIYFSLKKLIISCFFLKNTFIYSFVFGCAESSLLCGLFSLIAVHGLLIAVASLVAKHQL